MAKKTLGRRAMPKTTAEPLDHRAQPPPKASPRSKSAAPGRSKAPAKSTSAPLPPVFPEHGEPLGAHEQGLLDALVARTGLLPREVLARALSAYTAAVAPTLSMAAETLEADAAGGRLFVSVDGRKEIEIPRREFVFGSAEGVDLRLDLPLIAPRHARVLWKEDSPLFEDLRSPRGSFRHGQPVDVRMLESGDEIDLGGFLPLKFRLA